MSVGALAGSLPLHRHCHFRTQSRPQANRHKSFTVLPSLRAHVVKQQQAQQCIRARPRCKAGRQHSLRCRSESNNGSSSSSSNGASELFSQLIAQTALAAQHLPVGASECHLWYNDICVRPRMIEDPCAGRGGELGYHWQWASWLYCSNICCQGQPEASGV